METREWASAHEDVKSNDLPGPAGTCSGQQAAVSVLEDDLFGGGEDEGRAMLQIVHDVAPHASLAFATAFLGEESFAQNIERLARPVAAGGAGASAIADDVVYFEEPFFQDGPVAAAVNKVTGEGVTYLSSAGNDNLFEGENEIASWEAPEYRDSGGCPAEIQALAGVNGTHCIDFNPGPNTDRTFGIKVEPEATLTIDLQWAEPWQGVGTDLDAFLLNANGELVTGAAEDNLATQRPVEIVQWTNQSASEKTVQLVVNRYSGTIPRLKFALLQNGGGVSATEYPRSGGGDVVGPTVFGHAGAASAIAVGAVPFNNGTAPEEYSSRGPTTHYFGPVEGVAPAPALPSAEIVSKPDIVATDCNATTFFAHRDAGLTWRFCGTSAAAPHAAGTVALMSEAEPAATAGPLRAALVGTGTPMVPYGPCAVGGGLVESLAAAKAAHGDITPVAPEPCSPPGSAGEVFVAPGDWGSEEPPAPASAGEATIPVPGVTLEAPSTSFRRHPRMVVFTRGRTAQVVFRFGSNQAGVSFLCKVDRAPFRRCSARFVRRYAVGRHVVRVKARNSAGNVDATPALFRFRVKRVG